MTVPSLFAPAKNSRFSQWGNRLAATAIGLPLPHRPRIVPCSIKARCSVADAYGWPVDLTDEQILERLVALNQQRAEEERRGLIRWLRPEFQNPEGRTQQAIAAGEIETPTTAKKAEAAKRPWPKSLSAQAAAVQTALAELAAPADEVQIARRFTAANKDRIAELLETLSSLGKARQLDDGRYVSV